MEKQALFTLLKYMQNALKYGGRARSLQSAILDANKGILKNMERMKVLEAGGENRSAARRVTDWLFKNGEKDLASKFNADELAKLKLQQEALNTNIKNSMDALRDLNIERTIDFAKAAPVTLGADGVGAYLTTRLLRHNQPVNVTVNTKKAAAEPRHDIFNDILSGRYHPADYKPAQPASSSSGNSGMVIGGVIGAPSATYLKELALMKSPVLKTALNAVEKRSPALKLMLTTALGTATTMAGAAGGKALDKYINS